MSMVKRNTVLQMRYFWGSTSCGVKISGEVDCEREGGEKKKKRRTRRRRGTAELKLHRGERESEYVCVCVCVCV